MCLGVLSSLVRSRVRPLARRFRFLVGVLLPTMALAIPARAEEPVIRVEEDWVLVLNEPNDSVNSPQFHTIMSPFAHLDSYYAQVVWNYREVPEFTPGGLQLQSWQGETRIGTRTVGWTPLSTAAETITWTQSLETTGSYLLIQIMNGQSVTWGTFGKDMYIRSDANLPDLSGYTPDASAANSCITFGANRVDLFMVSEVRKYGVGAEPISVDNTPRIVYQRSAE